MNWDDTPANRVAELTMQYAQRYGITYEEAARQIVDVLKWTAGGGGPVGD